MFLHFHNMLFHFKPVNKKHATPVQHDKLVFVVFKALGVFQVKGKNICN